MFRRKTGIIASLAEDHLARRVAAILDLHQKGIVVDSDHVVAQALPDGRIALRLKHPRKKRRLAAAGPIYTRALTINHLKVPSDQTDFPVWVTFTDPTLKTLANGGHVHNASGYDIGFYLDSGGATKLKWEIERYNGTLGEVDAWAKIGTVSSLNDVVFYMRYGDASISTDQSDPVNTWSNGFAAVYHFKDGIILSTADSLGAFNMTSTNSPAATAGQLDGAIGLTSSSSQHVETPSNGPAPAALTMSA